MNPVASGWFCSCWIKQNKSTEMFKGLEVQSLQGSVGICGGVSVQWAAAQLWACAWVYLLWAQPVLAARTHLGDFLAASAHHWWLNLCCPITSSAAFLQESSSSTSAVKAGRQAVWHWLPQDLFYWKDWSLFHCFHGSSGKWILTSVAETLSQHASTVIVLTALVANTSLLPFP